MLKKAFAFVFVGFFILSSFGFAFGVSNVSFWDTWRGENNRSCYIKTDDYPKPTLSVDWNIPVGNNFCVYPVVWNNKVFVGNSKNFYAFDISTGSIIWKYESEFTTTHTPMISDGNVLLTEKNSGRWNIISLDGKTGKRNKKTQMLAEPTFMLSNDGDIYYSIQREEEEGRYSIYFKEGESGWSKRLPGEYTFDCLDNGVLFIRNAFYQKNNQYPPGNIYALDDADGDVLWTLEPEEGEAFDGHIIADNGMMFVGSKMSDENSRILAIDVDSGEMVWEYVSQSGISKCKALSGKKLLIANSTDGLACLDVDSGSLLWATTDTEMSDCVVAVTDEIVFACYTDSNLAQSTNNSMKSKLISLDIDDGDILSDKDFPHVAQSVVLDKDRLFISTTEGYLHCYKRKIALVGIIVKPTELMVMQGGKFQFDVINYDIREKEIPNLDIRWEVDPPGLGTIDKTGLFTAGDGRNTRGLVRAIHGDIFGVSSITICPEPELVTDKIDFGLKSPNDNDSIAIMFNVDWFCEGKIEVGNFPDWLDIGHPAINPETEELESVVGLNLENVKPGFYSGIVEYVWDNGVLELEVLVEIVGDDSEIITLSEDDLEFADIKSWETSELKSTFGIISTSKNPIGCSIKSDASWLSFYPVYGKVDKYQEIAVTCDTSKIRPGEKLDAVVTVTPDAGKPIELRVTANKLLNTTIVLQIDSPMALVDGDSVTLDVPPQIVSGRTMVPIRIISENLGAGVLWDGTEKKITINLINPSGNQTSVEMWVNKNTARVNGKEINLDAPPTVIDSRTLVPVRFITEAFGANVSWNQDDRTVTIVYSPS